MSGTRTTRMPAADAASVPASESSNATQSAGHVQPARGFEVDVRCGLPHLHFVPGHKIREPVDQLRRREAELRERQIARGRDRGRHAPLVEELDELDTPGFLGNPDSSARCRHSSGQRARKTWIGNVGPNSQAISASLSTLLRPTKREDTSSVRSNPLSRAARCHASL